MIDYATLLGLARAALEAHGGPDARPYLELWPARPSAARAVPPATLPVLRFLAVAAAAAPPGRLAGLAQAVARAAPGLAWRQSYREPGVGPHFLERYGWCGLFGPDGPVDCRSLAAGVLLLGPAAHYPSHAHRAEELYLVLSGTADWQRGDEPFAARRPGAVIIHASSEPHAMQTAQEPLLALYLWRGADLGAGARLVAPQS